jgi:hypothetical protein
MKNSRKRYFIRSFVGEIQELSHDDYMCQLRKEFNSNDTNTFNRMLEIMQLKYMVCGTEHLFWVR